MSGSITTLLDGDAYAALLRQDMAKRVAVLASSGRTPKLVTLLVGDHPASRAYIARKHADCAELGILSDDLRLASTTDQPRLMAEIERLNRDSSVSGFLVQLPLPDHLDAAEALEAVSPAKDVDGLHPVNLGHLMAGTPGLLPCTPHAILRLLSHHCINVAGKHVAIIGRGALVGRPLAMLLSLRGIDATVTLLNSATPDLAGFTKAADIVISAAGVPRLVEAAMIRPGTTVVGVGISYDADGTMISDIADDVADIAGACTPRRGSVGAVTRAMLLENLIAIAEADQALSKGL
ncbi:bifunctional 5,10-methylenetetrahydrofolate dehydrogenase/5,10-methenyltetrahydrofolate cyclohydrolase [Martelella sp. HB161492]|uniref:bifunctional 5,10-methylenetetrahydrofolate dehydrogenase/5,10-methenyltetrahydrofolate cyclohydrolase n=1 Tax=Martelella sp. HB161492 TaxID=2720726 RepID=UPI00159267A8|nr:bifunctional 5,10-methylenetetrahydrofolate dehydrogenase/5,10-methenyltetrahydrofolate cyclohydrolase [Martelella sp. HB161492]